LAPPSHALEPDAVPESDAALEAPLVLTFMGATHERALQQFDILDALHGLLLACGGKFVMVDPVIAIKVGIEIRFMDMPR
jgi:hypothetical protein